MSTNERAGILSAERLAEIRADLGAGASTESPWDLARALLAHIDALTPRTGETNADAARRLYYELSPTAHPRAWDVSDPDVRDRHESAVRRLHAEATIARITAELAEAHRAVEAAGKLPMSTGSP